MQRNVLLALAIVFCLATSAQATLTVVVGVHNFTQAQIASNPIQVIPITVTGPDATHGTDLNVQLGGNGTTVAPYEGPGPVFVAGSAPPITYQGSEQYNQPSAGAGAAVLSPSMWDQHPNTWGDSTSGNFDGVPSIPGSTSGSKSYGQATFEGTWFTGNLVFNTTTVATGQIVPGTGNSGIEVNLVVNLTGWNDNKSHSWPLFLLGSKAGASDFVDRSAAVVASNITDGTINIIPNAIPEPTSLVLGLFAVAGLGIVAIRKRRARRA
jgi:hypothetical protein